MESFGKNNKYKEESVGVFKSFWSCKICFGKNCKMIYSVVNIY